MLRCGKEVSVMLKGMTIVPMALSAMSYTPVGDIIVTGLSFLLFVLLMQTHIHKNHNFRVLVAMMGLAVVSAYTNIIYQMLLTAQPVHAALIYIFRFLHHAALFGLMFCSVHYLQEPLWIRQESRRLFNSLASMLIVLALLLDILGSMLHITFYIDDSGVIHSNTNIFIILYALMLIVQFYMIIHYKGRIIRQIYHGLLASNIIGYSIMAIQGFFHQSSFTTMAYFLPVIGLAFMSILAFWQFYDNEIPKILKYTFNLGETLTGVVMALDNVLALFLLPLFTVLIVLKIILGKNRKTLFTVFLTVFLLTVLVL